MGSIFFWGNIEWNDIIPLSEYTTISMMKKELFKNEVYEKCVGLITEKLAVDTFHNRKQKNRLKVIDANRSLGR